MGGMETRAAYNVTMQPGPELDALVARVMGNKLSYIPDYSTRISPAMEAWTWLVYNCNNSQCWLHSGKDGQHIVKFDTNIDAVVSSISWQHAIALAVVEAGKVLGVINIDIKP